MTFQIYLAAISWGAFAIAATVILGSISAVVSYYFYKWAAGLIRNRTRHLTKLKKHKMFKEPVKPAIRMVKEERKANGKT